MVHSRDINYGRGEHVIDVELVNVDVVSAALDATFGSPTYHAPVLPAVALQVYELSRQSTVDIDAICAALETDALLSADVLRITESGTFARATPCRSIREAAMRLGVVTLRDHVFRVALEGRVFRSKHFNESMNSLRAHSVAVGIVARRIVEETAHSPDFAFLSGVLHDIGLAAGLLVFEEWHRDGRYPGDEYAMPALMQIHAQAGERVATLWNLPQELRWIIGAHHSGKVSGYSHPIASACLLAESIVNELGFAVRLGAGVDTSHPRSVTSATACLALDAKTMDRIRDDAAELLA
ncbi:MAG: HDOD domain-containing protein [Polyangiales bacterium]